MESLWEQESEELGLEEYSRDQAASRQESDRLIKGRSVTSSLSEKWKSAKIMWKDNHAWPVFYSTLVVDILLVDFGIALGYASPAIPELKTDDKVTSINDTSIVFSALVPFGAMVAGPIAGIFLDAIGRHMTLMIGVAPYTIGWLLIILTRLTSGRAFLPILYTGRFFTGFGLGWANAGVPCYVAELSPSALRGLFSAFFSVFIATGILLIQLCGIIPGATYYWLAVVPLITLLIYVVLMATTTKETPRWLVQARKTEDARLVLSWLRGNNYDIDKELKEINEQVSKKDKISFVKKFKHISTIHPLILGCCLTTLPQLGGISAVIFYSQVIFSNVKSVSNDAGVLAALCVGGANVTGAFIFLLLVDKFGRRKLLLWGALIMCISAATMGVYYVLNSKPYCDPDNGNNKCVDDLTPLAIVSILAYCSSFSAAWGGLPYLVAAELLPLHVRGAGMGVVTFSGWLASTVSLLAYEPYQDLVNPWGAFFTFSFIMFIATLFVYKLIPETKGKTLEEIQYIFSKSTKRSSGETYGTF